MAHKSNFKGIDHSGILKRNIPKLHNDWLIEIQNSLIKKIQDMQGWLFVGSIAVLVAHWLYSVTQLPVEFQ